MHPVTTPSTLRDRCRGSRLYITLMLRGLGLVPDLLDLMSIVSTRPSYTSYSIQNRSVRLGSPQGIAEVLR